MAKTRRLWRVPRWSLVKGWRGSGRTRRDGLRRSPCSAATATRARRPPRSPCPAELAGVVLSAPSFGLQRARTSEKVGLSDKAGCCEGVVVAPLPKWSHARPRAPNEVKPRWANLYGARRIRICPLPSPRVAWWWRSRGHGARSQRGPLNIFIGQSNGPENFL